MSRDTDITERLQHRVYKWEKEEAYFACILLGEMTLTLGGRYQVAGLRSGRDPRDPTGFS